MDRLLQRLERLYERLHATALTLLQEWGAHANRRTILITLIAGIATALVYLYAVRPPDMFPTDQLVSVDAGQSVEAIGVRLEADGVIRSPVLFRVIVALLGQERNLHAGDYLFKQPEDVFTVARAIAIGQYGLEPLRIRVPEGATTKQMAVIFGSQLQRFDPQAFLAKAQPMEGYLFPDTYFFLPNATADTVIAALRQNFDAKEATIDQQIQASGHSLSDIVIMASILEREGRTMQDRQLIAGILWRRIRLGMMLQADATFLYTIPYGSPITKQVLTTDTPYNTYLHKGLPPGAIGSPSLSSLEAAATPIDKGYLFYLADRNGITHYCKTYACQVLNQRLYLGN